MVLDLTVNPVPFQVRKNEDYGLFSCLNAIHLFQEIIQLHSLEKIRQISKRHIILTC